LRWATEVAWLPSRGPAHAPVAPAVELPRAVVRPIRDSQTRRGIPLQAPQRPSGGTGADRPRRPTRSAPCSRPASLGAMLSSPGPATGTETLGGFAAN